MVVIHTGDDNSTAEKLFHSTKVLCFILCQDNEIHTKGKIILDLWGKRCNKIIFFTNEDIEGYPAIGLHTHETSSGDMTKKTFGALTYIYKNHLNNYDWFLKADTDTYMIMENLRYFLSGQNSSEAVFFGHHFHAPLHGDASQMIMASSIYFLYYSILDVIW